MVDCLPAGVADLLKGQATFGLGVVAHGSIGGDGLLNGKADGVDLSSRPGQGQGDLWLPGVLHGADLVLELP